MPVPVTSWLVLTLIPSTDIISVDLVHDNHGNIVNGYVPDGIPVNITSTLGNISTTSIVKGIAQSVLTSGTIGLAYIEAIVDNQQLTTSVAVFDNIPPTADANIPSGLYNTIKNVSLSMSEPGTIYYTTDGSTPTFNSNRYTSLITVASNMTLKFFAMDLAGNTSQYIHKTIQ